MEYSEFVEVYEAVSSTTKRLEKTAILAEFLKKLHKKGKSEWIYLLLGRVVPDYDPSEIGISGQLAIKAISHSFGIHEEEVAKRFKKVGDLGEIALEFSGKNKQLTLSSKKLTAEKVFSNLQKIMRIEGKGAVSVKMNLISEMLKSASGKEAKYIVRTLISDLRIGVSSPTLVDSLVLAFFDRENVDKKGKKDFNDLLVEVQIRSKLQHLWATAVEIVDFFTKQAIKSNEGQKEWIDFFRLVSSAFAITEKTPTIPGTPKNKKELYYQIKTQEEKLQVIHIMEGWTHAVKVFAELSEKKPNMKFFLLELDVEDGKLNLRGYPKELEEKAIEDYDQAEKKNQGKKGYDVVLVGADTNKDLRKAYPNYFVDSGEFLFNLQKIINKAK